MIISGVRLAGTSVYDASFNSRGALLYLDAGNTNSYSGSGTTWTDLSSNDNNATLTGSPTFTNAGDASYFTFNGTGSQYASTSAAKYNQPYTGKTVFIAARMNPNAWTPGENRHRCLFGTPAGTRNFNTYIRHDTSNNYQIHWSANGLGGYSNNIPLVADQWFVVTVTQTTGGLVTYYLNGQPVGTTTGQTFAQWINNGGETVAYSDNYWYGDISVVAVYGRVLNNSEIQQNYYTVMPRFTATFTSVGTTSWTAPAGVTRVQYLVVGGGGGGGNGYDSGGGGGAGGGMVLEGYLDVVPGNSYTVTVGSGGTGGANARANNPGTVGGNSVFGSVTALGGGLGNGSRTAPGGIRIGGAAQVGSTTAAQGGNGGGGGGAGGGGGGAGGAGGNGSGSNPAGTGGAGVSSSITGSPVTYGGGGNGGAANAGNNTGATGAANTGKGGGAGGANSASSAGGGNGGSGIVVIKYGT